MERATEDIDDGVMDDNALKSMPSQEGITYYAVHIPNLDPEEMFPRLYTDKENALRVVKKYKKARFKPFKTRLEAVTFSFHGSDGTQPHDTSMTEVDGTLVNVPNSPKSNGLSGVIADAEKPSSFKGPKAQDLVKLRIAIENGNLKLVKHTIWDNPRYLVSSGDTPAIMQEGSRYNALHIAAKSRNAAMAELILETVGNPDFFRLLYNSDICSPEEDTSVDRAAVMLDLYLNTPDKGMNETPLHFASKFGAVDVVKVLVSYSQCNRRPQNKIGHMPIDVVCSRAPNASSDAKKEIVVLLENEFYVPVLRSVDQSVQPVIGEPFSPKQIPATDTDPTRPPMEIHAFAGPMSKSQAEEFRKEWRTPQRVPTTDRNSERAHRSCPPALHLRDCEKGLERAGRALAAQHHVPWLEYWPFLDTFVNLASPEGLALLEDYLKGRFLIAHSKIGDLTPPTRNLFQKDYSEDSSDGSILSVSHDSLNSSGVEPEVVSPVSSLCSALNTLTIMDDSVGSGLGCGSPDSVDSLSCANTSASNGDLAAPVGWSQSFFDWNSRRTQAAAEAPSTPATGKSSVQPKTTEGASNPSSAPQDAELYSQPGLNPFLCVERGLRLFAKRIAAAILHHVVPGSTVTKDSVCEVLHTEVKHIQNLVSSYMDDERFETVGYQVVHSRIASCVAELLANDLSKEECDSLVSCLSDLAAKPDKREGATLSSDEDEEPAAGTPYRQPVVCRTRTWNKAAQTVAEHCVALQTAKAVDKLSDGSGEVTKTAGALNVQTEAECVALWAGADECSCGWPQPLLRHKRTPSTIKRERERQAHKTETANNSRETISRQLHFEDEQVEDDEAFFTPPSSIDGGSDVELSSDEEMESPEEGPGVFILGETPTRLDVNVLNAVSSCNVTPRSHPNIYRWKHSVELFSPEERQRWPSGNLKAAAAVYPPLVADETPQAAMDALLSTPKSSKPPSRRSGASFKASHMFEAHTSTPSWSRITGPLSPVCSIVARGTPPSILGSPSWSRLQ